MMGVKQSLGFTLSLEILFDHSISLVRFTFVVNKNVDVHFDPTKVYFEISPGN